MAANNNDHLLTRSLDSRGAHSLMNAISGAKDLEDEIVVAPDGSRLAATLNKGSHLYTISTYEEVGGGFVPMRWEQRTNYVAGRTEEEARESFRAMVEHMRRTGDVTKGVYGPKAKKTFREGRLASYETSVKQAVKRARNTRILFYTLAAFSGTFAAINLWDGIVNWKNYGASQRLGAAFRVALFTSIALWNIHIGNRGAKRHERDAQMWRDDMAKAAKDEDEG